MYAHASEACSQHRTQPEGLNKFARLLATFEENVCYTSSVRQVVPPNIIITLFAHRVVIIAILLIVVIIAILLIMLN